MSLFGGVDQQKEKRERACRHCALFDRQTVDPLEKLFEGCCIAVTMTACAGRDSELFDDLERLLSLEPLNHPTEGGGEPADIFVEREVLWASLRPRTIALYVDGHYRCEVSGTGLRSER